jgi:hypothetical protein
MAMMHDKIEAEGSGEYEIPDLVLVGNREAIWHLGQLRAYRRAQTLAPGSEASHFQAAINATWSKVVTVLARTPEHFEDLLSAGVPDDIYLDEKEALPVMRWNRPKQTGRATAWDAVRVDSRGPTDAPEITVSVPFRHIELRTLPSESIIIPVRDSRHTATAAVHEIIEVIERDFTTFIRQHDAPQAWLATWSQVSFMREAARIAMENLMPDSFRDWSRPDTTACAFDAIAERVDTLALTAHGQRVLALQLVSHAYMEAREEVDVRMGEATANRRLIALGACLRAMVERSGRALAVMNEALAATPSNTHGETASLMFIFCPLPPSTPVLAIIPNRV